MKKIENLDLLPSASLYEDVGEIISLFSKVLIIKIERSENELNLNMCLEDDHCNKLNIEFSGICDLEISNIDISNFEIVVLYIEDISNRQLDGIFWSIKNQEDFFLQFMCRDIKIKNYILKK